MRTYEFDLKDCLKDLLPAVREWLSGLELPQRYVVHCYPRKG